jgi:DNA-binding transcriptional ArsR family regulator
MAVVLFAVIRLIARLNNGKEARLTAKPNEKIKTVIDPKLIYALSHPLRGHVLATLNERISSPNEMAREIGVPVTDVSYHARQLRNQRYIELVDTARRRGATEHFYRASKSLLSFDDLAWARLPASIRPSISAELLELIIEEAVEALAAETFEARDRHLSRTAMRIDEQGWRDLMQALEETLDRVLAIRDESVRRTLSTGESGVPVSVAIAGFETADGRHRATGPRHSSFR